MGLGDFEACTKNVTQPPKKNFLGFKHVCQDILLRSLLVGYHGGLDPFLLLVSWLFGGRFCFCVGFFGHYIIDDHHQFDRLTSSLGVGAKLSVVFGLFLV